ncbi:MAG: HEPN domain-containing protein [Candidatus Lokiarchaeota archaeon]|nr:HEPN domain-containing protein [Candidatus Lokiarchaeota archaeon]
MKSIECFEVSINRSLNLIQLYDFLKNKRKREMTKARADTIREFLGWKKKKKIKRIDGKDSAIFFLDGSTISKDRFEHKYLSELLRSSLVFAVSAMDRYFHDIIVERSTKLLNRSEAKIPDHLKKLSLPLLTFKKTIQKIRGDKNSRVGTIIKMAIQNKMHSEFIFQSVNDISKAAKILGVDDFWRKVAKEMGSNRVTDVQEKLSEIVKRRHTIVHEADLYRKTKIKKLVFRDIKRKGTQNWIDWIIKFVKAADEVIMAQIDQPKKYNYPDINE